MVRSAPNMEVLLGVAYNQLEDQAARPGVPETERYIERTFTHSAIQTFSAQRRGKPLKTHHLLISINPGSNLEYINPLLTSYCSPPNPPKHKSTNQRKTPGSTENTAELQKRPGSPGGSPAEPPLHRHTHTYTRTRPDVFSLVSREQRGSRLQKHARLVLFFCPFSTLHKKTRHSPRPTD